VSRSLAQLDVLVLDCQSTGASPAHGHVLEVAWCRATSDSRRGAIDAHLVALPEGEHVPRRITAITGIRDNDLRGAATQEEVWERLSAGVESGDAPTPAVAHFARFERAFLGDLHERHGRGPFPFEWICTHEIARRLLPGLPRRGLRAVSGYFGRVMDEGKRAADHVRATREVWFELVQRLAADPGVTTLAELRAWMAETEPARTGGREFSVAREKRLQLTDRPGVYRMLGRRGQVLYIGKATSLRRRVNSYFQKRRHASGRTPEMLTQAFDLDVTETATALEAAVLESDEIKRHAPPYNVSLRGRHDDVFFLASDLSSVRTAPDALHREGPLPRGAGADAWVRVAALLVDGVPGSDEATSYVAALGLPEETPLDLEVARAGLALFAPRVTTPGLRAFLGLGARSWRELQARREAERNARLEKGEQEPAADDEGDVEQGEQREATDTEGPRESWTPREPEQVAKLVESQLRNGAQLLRRARFLRRLSESTVVWQTARPGDAAPWRMLVIEGAVIVHAEDVSPGAQSPLPRNWELGRDARCAAFDVGAYDRLRVLSTELRRLVTDGRDVGVRLAPRVHLRSDALARRLFWI